MKYFKNHFGMVMSLIMAICLSLIMATSAIFVDKLTFSVPLLVKNWGTAFLVIIFTSIIFPLTEWGRSLAFKLKAKPGSFAFNLACNFVATLFYNTGATLVLAAVNIFGNPEIEGAVAAGALPSVSAVYWQTVLHDWPIMFAISFVLAIFVTMLAEKIAVNAVAMPDAPAQQ